MQVSETVQYFCGVEYQLAIASLHFIMQMSDKLKADLVLHFHKDGKIMRGIKIHNKLSKSLQLGPRYPDFYCLAWVKLQKYRLLHFPVFQILHWNTGFQLSINLLVIV